MTAYRFTGMAAGILLGIVLAAHTAIIIPFTLQICLVVGGLVLLVAGWITERNWIAWPRMLIFLSALACTLPLGYCRTQHILAPSGPMTLRTVLKQFEAGQRLTMQGTIATEPEWREAGQVDITLQLHKIRPTSGTEEDWIPIQHGNVMLRVFAYRSSRPETIDRLHALALPAAYGNVIQCNAMYQPSKPLLNPHAFDDSAFLRQNGMETRMRAHITHLHILEERMGNPLTALALRAKTHFLETFKISIRSPASRIAAAATLGARRSVEDFPYRGLAIPEMFRHAGVGHVLAVSGLHVSVIAVLLFALFRMTGASPRVFVPPLIFFLILFALLTGARPSSVRAVVMNSVILFTIAYFRSNLRTATTIGLSASAFIILLKNPLLLFAPSFLLSYGAVLSLIVLAPPFERFLCTLRGFSFLLFLAWFGLLVGIAGWRFYWLTSPVNVLALAGLLWLLVVLGGRANHVMPRMWNTGFARLPPWLRMFIAAQLAIQIGMMLPLSSWFFGRFPVAGIMVNLIAIPIVGVLVQLGMFLGLIGMIPGVGSWLALPFGAATALVGETFLFIAFVGAKLFPFPATPQPSIAQLTVYYLLVAAVLLVEHKRHMILDAVYRISRNSKTISCLALPTSCALAASLLLLPWFNRPKGIPKATHLQILAVERFPLITIHGKHRADLMNAGNRFDGGRLLFHHLRAQGSVIVGAAHLPSPDPNAGIEGVVALADIVPIHTVLVPFLPAEKQNITDVLGDTYLSQKVEEGVFWANRYNTAFENLRQAQHLNLNPKNIAQRTQSEAQCWQNIQIERLPLFSGTTTRFFTSARTPILRADVQGSVWIVITDTMPEAITEVIPKIPICDVLIVPDVSARSGYFNWMRNAVESLDPTVLIVAGNSSIAWTQAQVRWLDEQQENGRIVIQTGIDGAITATLLPQAQILLQTYRSKRNINLESPTMRNSS